MMGIKRIINTVVIAGTAYFAIIAFNAFGIKVLSGLVSGVGIWVLIAFTFMELTFIKL